MVIMGKRNYAAVFVSLILIVLSYAGYANGETRGETRGGKGRFKGDVKEIDCAKGELKVSSGKDKEEVFYFDKEVKFRNINACEDIAAGGMAVISYSEKEGKKTASSIGFIRRMSQDKKGASSGSGGPRAKAQLLRIGVVADIDCKNGIVSIGNPGEATPALVILTKETAFEPPLKGCSDISKGAILTVAYEDAGTKKIAKKIKLAAKEEKK